MNRCQMTLSKRGLIAGVVVVLTLACHSLFAQTLDFTLHQQGEGDGDTLFVVAGIQGDEPGGFNAAALLVTRYHINKGNLWVVPNLNFTSIIERSRGVHGDMNRKFAALSPKDPEFEPVERIKRIILTQDVDLVVNLHDGSGFYRPTYKDKLHSPKRWGQSIVIDQERFDGPRYGELGRLARYVVKTVNDRLHKGEHVFHVKNTRTPEGNTEMAKTLTWFAVKNGKAAFGLEASKTLPTHLRAYYHLLALEAYMNRMGLKYERSFKLTPAGVKQAINDNIGVAFYENKMFLDVADARKHLHFVPLKKNAGIAFRGTNPLLAVTRNGKTYKVSYGNRRMTYLHPQYFEHDDSIDSVRLLVDGRRVNAALGTVVNVAERFIVEPMEGYRVNVIGWRREGQRNESGVTVRKNEIVRRFSVDGAARLYRVEVYRGSRFAGMLLVHFGRSEDSAQVSSAVYTSPPAGDS